MTLRSKQNGKSKSEDWRLSFATKTTFKLNIEKITDSSKNPKMTKENPVAIPPSRVSSLYSDFQRLKDLNPEGYEANIAFWENYIYANVNSTTFNIRDLLISLKDEKYGEPRSLNVPLDQMLAQKRLMLVEKFENPDTSLASSLKWALSKVVFDVSFKTRLTDKCNDYLKDIKLVHIKNLKELSQKCMTMFQKTVIKNSTRDLDLIFTFEDVHCLIHDLVSSNEEFQLLIKYLHSYSHDLVSMNGYVKFFKKGIFESKKTQISNTEFAFADLKWGITRLEMEIEKIDCQMSAHQERIKRNLHAKDITLLKSLLKVRKSMEVNKKNYILQQEKFLHIKNEIESAANNNMMFEVLTKSSLLLTTLNEEIESVSAVEELIMNIDEQIKTTEQISNALILSTEQDSEVDAELDQMLKEIKDEKKNSIMKESEKEEEKEEEMEEEKKLLQKLENLTLQNGTDLTKKSFQDEEVTERSKPAQKQKMQAES
ncbi:hypothetical protein ACO0RG_004548 [Hanseniaspora osmophila]